MAAPSLPRNLKELMEQLRGSVQGSLSARMSRISVETPIGFEFGVEVEKAKRKGRTKVLSSTDIQRSNRELARIFVGMFEGTGLVPLILFPTVKEANAAKELWAAPGLEARVQALVPISKGGGAMGGDAPSSAQPTTAAALRSSGGGGGFGGGGVGGGKRKGGKRGSGARGASAALSRVPEAAEVVVAVAPGEEQCGALRDFCSEQV